MSKNARMSKTEREDRKWAAMKIAPIWEHSCTPGPSHEQWMAWNNQHGFALRAACGLMMRTKDELAELVVGLESEERRFEDLSEWLEHSEKFFADMAKVIKAARMRLMVGASVVSVRIREGKLKLPEPQHHEKPKLRLVKDFDTLLKTELAPKKRD